VIKFVEVEGACVDVEIYSSKTAAWIFKEFEWGVHSKSRSVFLNGFMYMLKYSMIVVVDMEKRHGGQFVNHVMLKCPSIKLRVTYVCCVDFHNMSWLLM
jgi:hypothetical protein